MISNRIHGFRTQDSRGETFVGAKLNGRINPSPIPALQCLRRRVKFRPAADVPDGERVWGRRQMLVSPTVASRGRSSRSGGWHRVRDRFRRGSIRGTAPAHANAGHRQTPGLCHDRGDGRSRPAEIASRDAGPSRPDRCPPGAPPRGRGTPQRLTLTPQFFSGDPS